MNKEKHSPAKLRGAVLIMVLTIMFVLIFLLAGSIAVVYSANNRAVQKYQESQAYYTSRSILDTFIEDFIVDNVNVTGEFTLSEPTATTYNNSGYSITYDSRKTTEITEVYLTDTGVANATAKQGRALELDFYKLPVDIFPDVAGLQTALTSSDDPDDLPDWIKTHIMNVAAKGNSLTVKGYYKGTNPTINSAFTECKNSMTATQFSDTVTTAINLINPPSGFSSTNATYYNQFAADTATDELYYVIPFANLNVLGKSKDASNPRGYGVMSDDGENAYISVKMLERSYHVSDYDAATFAEKFQSGNRAMDYVKIQITSHIVYQGNPTTTSVIYKTKYDPETGGGNAITSLGALSGSTNGFPVSGGFSTLFTGTTPLAANGTSGEVFSAGSIKLQDSSCVYTLTEGDGWTIQGDLVTGNLCNIQPTGKNTFIYVGGALDLTTHQLKFLKGKDSDNHDVGIDILAHEVKTSEQTVEFSGKLYSDIYRTALSANDSKVTFTGKDEDKKIFTNELVLVRSNSKTCSDITEGTDTLSIKIKEVAKGLKGLYIGESITLVDVDGNNAKTYDISKCTITSDSSLTVTKGSGSVKLTYTDTNDYNNKLNSESKREFTPVSGANTYAVATSKSKYGSYYKEESFDAKGDFKSSSSDVKILSAIDKLIEKDVIKVDEDGKLAGGSEPTSVVLSSNGITIPSGNEISGSTNITEKGFYLFKSGEDSKVVNIDTSKGDVVIQFNGSGTYSGSFNVTGNNRVIFIVPEGANISTPTNSNGLFINDVDCGLISSGKTIINDTIVVNSPDPAVTQNTQAPKVDMVMGSGSSITFNNDAYIMGYIYGPEANINVGSTDTSIEFKYKDSDKIVSVKPDGTATKADVWCVGSVICGNYQGNNKGVMFIDGTTLSAKPGDKLFKWSDVLYVKGE